MMRSMGPALGGGRGEMRASQAVKIHQCWNHPGKPGWVELVAPVELDQLFARQNKEFAHAGDDVTISARVNTTQLKSTHENETK